MSIHANITDPAELHECKQIASAVKTDSGKVITPSSSVDGEGVLRRLSSAELSDAADIAKVTDLNATDAYARMKYITLDIPDISTANTEYVAVDELYEVVSAHVVLYGAITVANATITIADGTTTHGTVVIDYTTSGAGVKYESTFGSPVAIDASRVLMVSTDGGSTTAGRATVTIALRQPV